MGNMQDLLRRLRDRGLTQTEIARRTGIPQPRISRWEGGRAPAGADDALKLLKLEADTAPQSTQPEASNAA